MLIVFQNQRLKRTQHAVHEHRFNLLLAELGLLRNVIRLHLLCA
jgi:hypothetical protein